MILSLITAMCLLIDNFMSEPSLTSNYLKKSNTEGSEQQLSLYVFKGFLEFSYYFREQRENVLVYKRSKLKRRKVFPEIVCKCINL